MNSDSASQLQLSNVPAIKVSNNLKFIS
jgi:hypothetical protein